MLDSATPKIRSLRLRLMSKRLISTTLLSFALLFAQGGSFLIAAFCPHVRKGIMRCDTSAQESQMDHHHMSDMQMDQDSDELPLDSDAPALDRSTGNCTHCAVHSRTTSSVFSVRHVEAVKRTTNLAVPLVFRRPEPAMISPQERLTARSHGPPGGTIPRHILIDIFRI
jgi:hypothetical protein